MSSKNLSTRDRILQASLKLLQSGEGSAVRMSDIAKGAKISRQALYLHFPTRADLLIATTQYLDEINDIEGKLVESRTAISGEVRLMAWVDVWGNYIPVMYGVGKALWAMMDSDEEARAAWDDRMSAVKDGCRAAVADLKRDSKLTDSLSESEATDYLWALLSVRGWELLRIECKWTQERYIEVMKQLAAKTLIKAS